MKMLGILGGMGPESTAFFYKKVIQYTPAMCDQDHIPTIIFSNTQIPSRTIDFTRSETSGIRVAIEKTALFLQDSGADVIVMPCNTAHFFSDAITSILRVPFLNMIEETATFISKKPRVKSVGIIGTAMTINLGLYHQALSRYGIDLVSPDPAMQDVTTSCIAEIKAGKTTPQTREMLDPVIMSLRLKGASHIILACTEIPLVFDVNPLDIAIDPMDVLAEKVVQYCLC